MEANNDNINFGDALLSMMSLLESAVTGNLLNDMPVDGLLYRCHRNISKALVDYLNNSTSSNDVGKAAFEDLVKYVNKRQDIFNRKCALDITGEYEAVHR